MFANKHKYTEKETLNIGSLGSLQIKWSLMGFTTQHKMLYSYCCSPETTLM